MERSLVRIITSDLIQFYDWLASNFRKRSKDIGGITDYIPSRTKSIFVYMWKSVSYLIFV